MILTPDASSSESSIRIWTINGKVKISCYLSNDEPVDYDTYIEKYAFDDTPIKAKISLLHSMDFDINDVPESLKEPGIGQK